MAVKTPFLEQDFNQILSQYELGEFTYSEPISQGTAQGKFVFRYYENRSKESVLFESHLLTYLAEHQYPCPVPFQNKQGTRVGISHGKPYVIFEFIDGQHVDHYNNRQKQQLIQMVAELHNLTRDYQPKYKKYRWNYDVELCKELAFAEAQKINTEDAQAKFSWLVDQLSLLNLPETIPKGICHCDFDPSNVLYKHDQFVGLLDFDDANFTYLIFDLVCLIDWEWLFPSVVFNFKEASKIAAEYARYRPISAIEQRHVFDVHKLGILYDCVWYFWRGQANDFREKRKIEFLNKLGWDEYSGKLFSNGTRDS